jgi:hypothetical protein
MNAKTAVKMAIFFIVVSFLQYTAAVANASFPHVDVSGYPRPALRFLAAAQGKYIAE